MSNRTKQTAPEIFENLGKMITRLSETIDAGSTLAHDIPEVQQEVLRVFNVLSATIRGLEAKLETDLMDLEFIAQHPEEEPEPLPVENPEVREVEVFRFLDSVRESGAINMFGAGQFISEMFGTEKQDSRRLLLAWMEQFKKEEK